MTGNCSFFLHDSRLIVGVGVYFVMGAVVMRVKFNASGQDLIPNRAFWKSLPGLIKVG